MDHKTTQIDTFLVAGITVRTINKPGHADKDIGELWQRFFQDNVAANIPGKLSDDVYCVYSNYESDYTGHYTTTLGCKVESIENLHDGFGGVEVPGGSFHQYQTEGEMPAGVIAAWQHIWTNENARRYTADFEVYPAQPETEGPCMPQIFVAV
ncbi:GyrI-like domain-containing protein [Mucilaginibacter pedocola]|uniref:AraC effector-binding domain-containing protein n=1 Tax=Mucilaginibacter pedocola TaxID=1792845 RepID=A0A1S9PIW6_9SPHI|nr:GyrI-like domain-containing protein [Mucilaginibacter pedocola]OOQ60910.1 hypothetical protein BC343_23400 [Mucilaginibacter pedocola]